MARNKLLKIIATYPVLWQRTRYTCKDPLIGTNDEPGSLTRLDQVHYQGTSKSRNHEFLPTRYIGRKQGYYDKELERKARIQVH